MHDNAQGGRPREGTIRGKQGGIVQTCRRHIKGVISAYVMPMPPGFAEQSRVWNAIHRPGRQVVQCQPSPAIFEPLAQNSTAQDGQDLNIKMPLNCFRRSCDPESSAE